MKNKLIIIISCLVSFVIFYSILFFFTFLNFKNEFKYSFKTLKNLEIHEKYSKKIHHIREEINLLNYFKKTTELDLIFTSINKFKKESDIVLFQGDSWFEQINGAKKTNFFSYTLLEKFGKDNNLSFINAAASSYSPTLMNLQLDLLEKDFKIFPDIVVAYIDQVNIGDELCRYKKNKVYSNGKLASINPETDFSGPGWYNYSELYGISRIYLNNNNKFLKTFQLINFKIYYKTNQFLNKIKKNFLSDKKNEIKKCYFEEVEKYLIKPTKEDIRNFEKTIEEYIEKVKEKKNIKKLILVTFPYKKHFESSYNYHVSDSVERVVSKKENIEHLNFSKLLLNDKKFKHENIWFHDQIHLNAITHANLFIKKILTELSRHI